MFKKEEGMNTLSLDTTNNIEFRETRHVSNEAMMHDCM